MLKHRLTPDFHFKQPLSALSYISRENYYAYRTWFYQLNGAQKLLFETVNKLAQFEKEVEAVFVSLERQICALKDEHLTALQTLKTEVETMITKAISETSEKALFPSPDLSEPLSQWIWWYFNPVNANTVSLYDCHLQIASEPEIRNLCCVSLTRNDDILPEFGLN